MLKIAVVNTKGGVGKTTLACALAVRAAGDAKRIAMVDLDPQRSLIEWWRRRGAEGNPEAYDGVDTPEDAIERLEQTGVADIVFLDGPPAFLSLVKEMVEVADFAIIPVRPSTLDLLATQDAVVLAQQAGTPFLCVINDVSQHDGKVVEAARKALSKMGIPLAEVELAHRVSHIQAMTVGKSAAEVNKGKDKLASEEIDRLWVEVKAAAAKAVRARNRRKVPHDD
jgi:chromosome partitioning protein